MSNFAAWQIAELRHAAADQGVPDPVIAQQVYNVVATRLDDEYAEYADASGLPTVVYNPLAGGLLTGKHSHQQIPDAGRFGDPRLGGMYRDRYWNDTVFAAVTDLQNTRRPSRNDNRRTRTALDHRPARRERRHHRRLTTAEHPRQPRRNRQRAAPRRPSRSRHRDLHPSTRTDAALQPVTHRRDGHARRAGRLVSTSWRSLANVAAVP